MGLSMFWLMSSNCTLGILFVCLELLCCKLNTFFDKVCGDGAQDLCGIPAIFFKYDGSSFFHKSCQLFPFLLRRGDKKYTRYINLLLLIWDCHITFSAAAVGPRLYNYFCEIKSKFEWLSNWEELCTFKLLVFIKA